MFYFLLYVLYCLYDCVRYLGYNCIPLSGKPESTDTFKQPAMKKWIHFHDFMNSTQ